LALATDTTDDGVFIQYARTEPSAVPKALDRFLKRMRELRKLHHLTQEQFSEVSQISYKYYQALEAGRKSEVRLSTVERVADVDGLQVYELLAPETPKSSLTKKPSPRSRRKR